MDKISLRVNCGYCRVAMKELADKPEEFKQLFQQALQLDDSYFESYHGQKLPCKFKIHAKEIKHAFSKRWHPQKDKKWYESIFSLQRWNFLQTTEKQLHSLEKCNACFNQFYAEQKTFPLKPIYTPQHDISMTMPKDVSEGTYVAIAIEKLDKDCEQRFGKPFVETLVKCKIVEKSKSQSEKLSEKRKMLKKCRDTIYEGFKKTIPEMILKENESIKAYTRKRKAQYFAHNPAKKKKSHSPTFDNVSWDTATVLDDLKKAETLGQKITWSSFAREHGVCEKNGGQIIKEFAESHNINTAGLSKHASHGDRVRASKLKFPGKQVAIAVPPPPATVREVWKTQVESGELKLGVMCTPYTISRFSTTHGKLNVEEIKVQGRKIPLKQLRARMLLKHEKYMHLYSDEKIKGMTNEEIRASIAKYKPNLEETLTREELSDILKAQQRTRHLAIWHDHATVLSKGYILITIHTLYDPAVHIEDMEEKASVQTLVEEPQLYMFALNSSSVEDQAAIIPDRVECLQDLDEPVYTSEGVPVNDVMKYFVGDHPAQQFERGTQVGGNYKCGGCGCRSQLMDDQAHALRCTVRSLQDIQSIALDGVFGKVPKSIKPLYLPDLSINEIRKELAARGRSVTKKIRSDMQQELQDILQGIQRVPSLLILQPEQNISNLHLQRYAILDCEPMHDIKGHILNLLQELPAILPPYILSTCNTRIKQCLSKEKKSAADLRTALIHIYLILTSVQGIAWELQTLVQSLLIISEIFYSSSSQRSPKLVLQLYNNVWLHHQLCYDIFQTPTSRTSLFGLYLHAISCHAPKQFELVCLKSVNSENQERMFGQCRQIAEHATNRHPENIIVNVVLRMQKKTIYQTNTDTIVSKAAESLPAFDRTHFPANFINKYKDSWQAHLEQISPYLLCGENEWWRKTDNGFTFHDGAQDPPYQSCGPNLLHFRDANEADVKRRHSQCWKQVLENNIPLPTTEIKTYTQDGHYISTQQYTNATPQPQLIANPMENSHHTVCSSHAITNHPVEAEETMDSCSDSISYSLKYPTHHAHQLEGRQTEEQLPSSTKKRGTVIGNPNENCDYITECTTEGLKTTMCRSIAQCTGVRKEVIQLDKLRQHLKEQKQSNKTLRHEDIHNYETVLSKVKTIVSHLKTSSMDKISDIEKQFYAQHGRIPVSTNDSELWAIENKKKTYAAKLLQAWDENKMK